MSWFVIFAIICGVIVATLGFLFFIEWLKNSAPDWVVFLVFSIAMISIATTLIWFAVNCALGKFTV